MKLRKNSDAMARSLDGILAEDDSLGLLAGVMPEKPKDAPREDQAVANFKPLVAFYQQHQREPNKDIAEERALAIRLEAYRTRDELRAKVQEYDSVGLLREKSATPREVATLEDIFDDDDLGLLGGVDASVFSMSHARPSQEKELPDEIASRKPCEDFYRYEKFFQDVQRVLGSKAIMLERFSSESEAAVGQVFILRGQLCYVDRILKEDVSDSGRDNPRLRVIFENGTEADLLKRSLARALYKDPHSRRVNSDLNLFSNSSVHISQKDSPTGFIYILGTESAASALVGLKAAGKLVKIGYSTQDIHERIKNAENDRTYLESPVRVLASIECYNLNPQKFENLIHAFLYQQRVNIALTSKDGSTYHPEEWFAVDVHTAVAICERIIGGSITQYRMDNTTGNIVKKK